MRDSCDMALNVDSTYASDTTGRLCARGGFVPANADARRGEVSSVRVGLETDEVCTEHAIEDFFATCKVVRWRGEREVSICVRDKDKIRISRTW